MAESGVRFYAVEKNGPRRLDAPDEGEPWLEVYDRLELGSYSRLRSYPVGRYFGLQEHLDRLEQSRDILGLEPGFDQAHLRHAIQEVTEAFPARETLCRFDLLARPALALGTSSPVLLCMSDFTPVPPRYKEEGVGVLFSDLVRRDPLAKRAAFVRERGGHSHGGQQAYEKLLLGPGGLILEGTSSNVFALVDGTLRTAQEGVLQGVTQRFCLRLASDLGLRAETRAIHEDELPRVEEAFLTSASRGVVPIVRIAGEPVADGRPGPWTRRLLSGYDELAEGAAKPAWPLA